jgi:hypothetical protein
MLSACGAVPATSAAPSQTSLLPDGVWEAQLSVAELVAAGAQADATAGVYRWTFDGDRARITVNGDEAQCDGDAVPAGSAVRVNWHIAFGCGGFDEFAWSIDGDGLHFRFVGTNGDEASTRATLQAKPYQRVEGEAVLSWSDAWKTCQNPEGGACRNTLKAGTYTTDGFEPGLTYTMPAGWQNLSDTQGEVFFVAPGYAPDDVHAEYIGVFTSVRAENRHCRTEEEASSDEPGVARTPDALAAEFQARPGLVTTKPKPATLGGLSGLVMDITMKPGWDGKCFYWDGPAVQLLGGVQPSEFDHGIIDGLTMRLYLLKRGQSTVAVEIDDYAGGDHLGKYSRIVDTFQFGS